jgi:aspartyl/asparaginyl beta-hydroxylase (cupin superfamily)
MNRVVRCFLFALVFGAVIAVVCSTFQKRGVCSTFQKPVNLKRLLNQRFYDWKTMFPFLRVLTDHRDEIRREVEYVAANQVLWKSSPEKHQQKKNHTEWSLFPIYGFGHWVEKNSKICPTICRLAQSIPNLKTLLLSRLSAGMELAPHRGWRDLANHSLRVHYGVISNSKSKLVVDGEERHIKEGNIIVFDDSKIHYAKNEGDRDRIVLLLDIERPPHVQKGEVTLDDGKELQYFIQQMKLQ